MMQSQSKLLFARQSLEQKKRTISYSTYRELWGVSLEHILKIQLLDFSLHSGWQTGEHGGTPWQHNVLVEFAPAEKQLHHGDQPSTIKWIFVFCFKSGSISAAIPFIEDYQLSLVVFLKRLPGVHISGLYRVEEQFSDTVPLDVDQMWLEQGLRCLEPLARYLHNSTVR